MGNIICCTTCGAPTNNTPVASNKEDPLAKYLNEYEMENSLNMHQLTKFEKHAELLFEQLQQEDFWHPRVYTHFPKSDVKVSALIQTGKINSKPSLFIKFNVDIGQLSQCQLIKISEMLLATLTSSEERPKWDPFIEEMTQTTPSNSPCDIYSIKTKKIQFINSKNTLIKTFKRTTDSGQVQIYLSSAGEKLKRLLKKVGQISELPSPVSFSKENQNIPRIQRHSLDANDFTPTLNNPSGSYYSLNTYQDDFIFDFSFLQISGLKFASITQQENKTPQVKSEEYFETQNNEIQFDFFFMGQPLSKYQCVQQYGDIFKGLLLERGKFLVDKICEMIQKKKEKLIKKEANSNGFTPSTQNITQHTNESDLS